MKLEIITHEKNGKITHMNGRTVCWLQTPESTGGQYSSVCTCLYEPGARAKPAHSHPHGEETVYVVSGTGRVKIGEEIADIGPGSLFLFPQGVPHMVWNNGGDVMKIVCFYAPNSEAIEYAFHETFDFPEFLNEGKNQ